jgi:hypothetical protein
VVRVVPYASHAEAVRVGPVLVGDAELSIPYRIYNDEPAEEILAELTAAQRLVVHVFYTRHRDGRIRERHLDQVIGMPQLPSPSDHSLSRHSSRLAIVQLGLPLPNHTRTLRRMNQESQLPHVCRVRTQVIA